ncbi:MAG: glycoside hydrolase family 3 C-terminal domain-containing protein [Ardenticatenaceae bacterium]|nr:glycoside hydrolase family 3 C-terminal domain-containing protein [Ardenticatenaceae bacterium]
MNERIDDILQAMTLAEKVSLLAGTDMWRTAPIPRLGIPALKVTDGPNGARGQDGNTGPKSACFPVGAALGATWNPALVEQVGAALAEETKAKGAHVLLAPTVNIHRTPIAGRNFECYAEDPFLSGTMASAYIRGLQSQGVAACIKHFVCNEQEFERFSMSSEVAERPLHEIYLEPFRIAMAAQPWSLMSSYNRVNGVHASENDLLHDVLKEGWGYDGAVISDWYGTYSDNVPNGRLDLEMPGPARWMDPEKIIAAVEAGEMAEAHIDDKVRRLLRLLARVGAFDQPELAPEQAIDRPAHRRVARRAAAEAIVLLKNEGDLLPLDPTRIQSIAVIGENARWAQIMGGGSSAVNPFYMVSPLAGIRRRAGTVQVNYALGTPIHWQPPTLDMDWVTAVDGQSPGFTLTYYDNPELEGEPVHTQVVDKSAFSWFGTVDPYVDPAHFSARLQGRLTVPEDGEYELVVWQIGRARLWVDGQLLIDRWAEIADEKTAVTLSHAAGKPVDLTVEYSTAPDSGWRTLRLGCQPPLPADPLQTAVDLAAQSDVAIIVAGLTNEWESEGFDRTDMALVGRQNELISRVAAANPHTVVVLNVGSPVEMPWLAEVPAILQQWYGGQEAGNALADVLFGDVTPSGKLPTTFPVRLEDNPAFINYPGENGRVHYGEGIFVGYRFYDKKRLEPLFPFGHGLSYTTFAYENLRLNGETFGSDDEILVSVDVTNTGPCAGQEVVQVYVSDVESRLVRPLQELKAFAKIHLEPGECQTVTLKLTGQSLAYYDPAASGWVVEPGEFVVRVGSSSRDVRLEGRFAWDGATAVSNARYHAPQLSTVPT